jgi:O-antigen ligase
MNVLEAAVKSTQKSARVSSLFFSATRSWFWLLCADIYPALVAASVPWSTTAVAVFMIVWFIVLIPTIEPRAFLRSLKQPASFLPVVFFGLAIVGTLWADGPWSARLHGVSPVAKLLAIPFLLYHFERSKRGAWVFVAFLLSCTALLGLSWIVLFAPEWKIGATETAGVPLKNSIDQSQEFALCIFGLASLVLTLFKQRQLVLAAGCAALMVGFFCNMMFAVLARTALVYMAVLSILFAVRNFRRGEMILLLGGAIVTAVLVWFTSPYLRERVEHVRVEYQEYRETNRPTSTGERLEFWRMSIHAVGEAPLFGHGTGATKQMFDREAVGKSGAWADSIRNPHNQTLYVAVQWGALGCIVLYAMWYFHLLLFREMSFTGWIGLIVVVQNVVSSLLNSHLFDFHEGWMYVLGVGVAGGLLRQEQRRCLSAESVGERNNARHFTARA